MLFEEAIKKWQTNSCVLDDNLECLATILVQIKSTMRYKVGARGWCYLLEGEGLIDKNDFDNVAYQISTARKRGFLPWDFVAEDETRLPDNYKHYDVNDLNEYIKRMVLIPLNAANTYNLEFWQHQKYYVEVWVEKIDIKQIFEEICSKYHILISTTRGNADINQRCQMMGRFKDWQDKYKLQPVLLHASDFDPAGRFAHKNLRKTLMDLKDSVGWLPNESNLIIDRIGLEFPFIIDNNIKMINNLITSSGKDLSDPSHKSYKTYDVENYMKISYKGQVVGKRKCELNCLINDIPLGQSLFETAINKFITKDDLIRFNNQQDTKRKEIKDKMKDLGLRQIYDKLDE